MFGEKYFCIFPLKMKDFHLRPATLDDLETLFEFEQGVISAERPFDATLKPEKINYYDLSALIQSSDSEVIIALDGSQIIGSGYARIKLGKSYVQFEEYAYLGFMFVRPEYRGKGIIGTIMEGLMDWVKSRGISEVQLEVYNDNQAAVRAYEKFGFEKQLVRMRMAI
jgi:GNAT superfamily N-acetyltransferase